MGFTNPETNTSQEWADNICYQSSSNTYTVSLGRGSSSAWTGPVPEIDHNLYYGNPSYYDYEWQGSRYRSLATFQAGTGQDLHSQEIDPLFVDASSGDYRPQGSACNMSSTGSYVGAYPCLVVEDEPYCGDKICQNDENCRNCSEDCGSCGGSPGWVIDVPSVPAPAVHLEAGPTKTMIDIITEYLTKNWNDQGLFGASWLT